ncbi:MAG: acylphosphatase [Gammaproteobacteria bacterium]
MSREKETLRCCRAYVSGRVQGVGFRYATRAAARRLGVRGYASNLSDGRVEVLILGEHEAVQAMLSWLEHGPPAARVNDLRCLADEPLPNRLPTGFDIL